MKLLLILAICCLLFACNHQQGNTLVLQKRLDSLEQKLTDTYKPGYGEFMSLIQAHHAKLWFAGYQQNWILADFEIHEIMETVEDIQKYQTERKESQLIRMINPALDSMNDAIAKKSPALFKSSYTLLTNTCNNCHRAANFGFNVVKAPDIQTFSNQDFRANE